MKTLLLLACMTIMSCGASNPMQPGDVNFDGAVDSLDARLVITYILRGDSLDDATFIAADITGDSTISTLDVHLILKSKLARIPTASHVYNRTDAKPMKAVK